jgi:ribulose-5-phosphate 4-epimerase/fuculose-1-phosphate aldolase
MTLSPSTKQRLLTEAPALCEVIRDIHRRGWCDGTGGNFSSLLCREPYSLLMAPSGVDKGSLQPENLIVVDESGQVICGDGQASAETFLHQSILATTKAAAVLHTHSQAATLLSRFPTFPATGESQTVSQDEYPMNNQGGSRDSQQRLPSMYWKSDGSAQGVTLSDLSPARRTSVPTGTGSDIAQLSQNPFSPRNDLHLTGLTHDSRDQTNDHNQFLSAHPSPSHTEHLKPTEIQASTTLPVFLGYLLVNGLEMLKGLEGISSHDTSIAIPVLENCQDMRLLSQSAGPHLAQAPHGLLIAGHGLYAWGSSLFQARRHLEVLEFLLEQQWRDMLLASLTRNT